MPTPANINTLTQFAKGLFQETANPLADKLAPPVTTGAASFYVIDYAKRSAFQAPTARRAIGGDSKAVMSDGDRVKIDLNPNSLHDLLDDHEFDLAGTPEGQKLLRESRIRNLVSQCGNSRLADTLSVLRTQAATAEVWGSSDNPITDIDNYIKKISDNIGIMPTDIVFSLGAWSIFRNHAKVIERFPGATTAVAQPSNVGGLLLNPNINVEIATTVLDTPLSAASTKKNALDVSAGAEVWIYYSAGEKADLFDASFAKTFRVTANPFQKLRMVRKDHGEKWISDWTESAYINNAAAGERLTITAA